MKRRTAIRIISYLCCALVAVGAVARLEYGRAEQYRRYVDVNYDHAFGELVSAVDEIDATLRKSVYVTSPQVAGTVCAQLCAVSNTAAMAMGVLPADTNTLEKTAGFINRVGDYALSLAAASPVQGGFTDEQREGLRSLSAISARLTESLTEMEGNLRGGGMTMREAEKYAGNLEDAASETEASPVTLSDGLQAMEEGFDEYPSLIYDGPYSDHLRGRAAAMTEGREPIDEAAARSAAAQFLGLHEGRVHPVGHSGGELPCWLMEAELEGVQTTVALTEQGGLPASMICSHVPGEAKLTEDEAAELAGKFLTRRGYQGMAERGRLTEDGQTTFMYAFTQDGVVFIPDGVKVRVALDTGRVTGFDASGYIASHRERQLETPAVTAESAASAVAAGLAPESSALVVIPTEGGNEKLCHEFVCAAAEGERCIIYVNAMTGAQERILLLLRDENGTRTI